MNKQKQYYINGLILISIAIISVTLIPLLADKLKIYTNKDFLCEFEFFSLTAGALYFLFSPKYYKHQVLSIVFIILYYLLFLKIYPLI